MAGLPRVNAFDTLPSRYRRGEGTVSEYYPRASPSNPQAAWGGSGLLQPTIYLPGYLGGYLPGTDPVCCNQPLTSPVTWEDKGGRREPLVQFAKDHHENTAWVLEKFVPRPYLKEFWERVEPDGPHAPAHD